MANKLNVKNRVLKNNIHYLTSDYKTRNEDRNKHNGMDFVGLNKVDDVVAIETGIVANTGYDNSGGGYYIYILTNNIEHRYFHLEKGSLNVKKGDKVIKGSVIARMGKSGNATNYNLHFAIYKDGKYIDPLPFLMNDNPFNIEDAYKTFVRDLQKAIGAKVDGIAGSETLAKTITVSTSKNYRHKAVKVLQTYLKALGYNLGKYDIDGRFGPDMKRVIKEYQKQEKLKIQDGIITARMYTWKSLLKL